MVRVLTGVGNPLLLLLFVWVLLLYCKKREPHARGCVVVTKTRTVGCCYLCGWTWMDVFRFKLKAVSRGALNVVCRHIHHLMHSLGSFLCMIWGCLRIPPFSLRHVIP